jgi:hypothetical protein
MEPGAVTAQPSTSLRNILGERFRANPGYVLALFEQLPAEVQPALQELTQDDSFYGVLMPLEGANLPPKAVDQETALLWFTLHEAAPVPQYVRRRFGAGCNQAVAELVLGGILAMSDGGDGFVTGAAAQARVFAEGVPAHAGAGAPSSRLALLSHNALRYVQALGIPDEAAIAWRLYLYNGMPYTPAWRARLGDADAVLAWLGVAPGTPGARRMARHWKALAADEHNAGWRVWKLRDDGRPMKGPNGQAGGAQALPYKLYISPRPELLPELWPRVTDALAAAGVPVFKVGHDAHGILRPDKLVAYLGDFDSLARLAQRLQAELAGCAAQGVPFTAPIDAGGLLSWGMDPPRDPGRAAAAAEGEDAPGESWRQWVTTQLARALAEGLRTGEAQLGVPPWQYAMSRLQLQDVDVGTWTPRQAIWRAA